MSIDQLELLNTDDQYMSDFIDNMAIMKKPNDELDQLLTEVEEIASNLIIINIKNLFIWNIIFLIICR